ncbi:Ig-like domain protein [Cheloniid poxvirus 1]|nr:Ig-like domain protein [Cheloniid poxvirus 1]
MIGKIHFIYINGIRRKELILLVFLGLINIANAFVLVNTPDSYLLVPRNSSINVTCTFTDDQGAGADAVYVSWSRENGNQDIKEGVETDWNETSQSGETRLLISNITNDEEKYTCIVSINGSADYKRIKIQSVNITHEKTLDNKVEVTPYMEEVNICNGPPLKLNCSFEFRDPCTREVRVGWWEYNNDTQVWGKHLDGISWVSNSWNGIGWLNISNPGTETTFMCAVTCGDVGNIGIRVMVPVPPQPRDGEKIKTRYNTYPSVENMDVLMSCNIEKYLYTDYGWWFNGSKLYNGEKYNIQSKDRTMELIVKKVSNEDVGNFTCWVAKDDWWDAASVTLSITKESY